ncbi:MAG TPA: isoprenylcysteine carboxylmethyltransferase family protein [Caulobacterales bacterium]|nr:isoprenylcysteine carboxylmethyltransferase family protein [Caulobacterales bacterium]
MNELLHPQVLLILVWALWVISWFAAAAWSSRVAARPGLGKEAPNRILTVLGAILIGGRVHVPGLPPLWPPSDAGAWAALAAVLAGVAFTWWARVTLGALWSGSVTRKHDHRIIDTGPYGVVRHPIYTGILLGVWATALFLGRIEALFGALLMTAGFWLKARLEESFLVSGLGEAAYADYKRRVPMLLPLAKGWG